MRAFRTADRLGEVTMPVLMIAGAADGLLAANIADYQRLPNATLQVFSHAGHEVAIHEPDGVARCIDQFMQMGVITGRTLMERLRD
jgi:pimeloyl-ACP methyl ester carboxylesterase